jgi:hypothetical protein
MSGVTRINKKIFSSLLFITLGLLSVRGWAEDPQRRIFLYIGGFGPSYKVQITGNKAVYENLEWGWGNTGSPTQEESFDISEEHLENFIRRLKEIGIETWEKDYTNDDILDGTGWKISINTPDLTVSSSGSNAFPENFSDYLNAVQDLIEGRTFK